MGGAKKTNLLIIKNTLQTPFHTGLGGIPGTQAGLLLEGFIPARPAAAKGGNMKYKFDNKKLKWLRNKRKMAKTDLAKAAGVHEATIRRLESGCGSSPSIDTVAKLAAALGVFPKDFITKN